MSSVPSKKHSQWHQMSLSTVNHNLMCSSVCKKYQRQTSSVVVLPPGVQMRKALSELPMWTPKTMEWSHQCIKFLRASLMVNQKWDFRRIWQLNVFCLSAGEKWRYWATLSNYLIYLALKWESWGKYFSTWRK